MDLDVVDSLLLYIYTGRVNRSNLLGLKSAGDFFDIGDLKKLIDGELEQGNASRKTNSDCLKVKWKSIKSPMRSITHYKCHFCHFKVSIIFFSFIHFCRHSKSFIFDNTWRTITRTSSSGLLSALSGISYATNRIYSILKEERFR